MTTPGSGQSEQTVRIILTVLCVLLCAGVLVGLLWCGFYRVALLFAVACVALWFGYFIQLCAAICLALWLGLNWERLGWQTNALTDPAGPPHAFNWFFGWLALWAAVLGGAAMALFAADDEAAANANAGAPSPTAGNPASASTTAHRRRLAFVGFASLAALGAVNVLYGISPWPPGMTRAGSLAAFCFVLSGILLPAVCFLTLWQNAMRFLLVIPVVTLSLAVFCTLRGNDRTSKTDDFSAMYDTPRVQNAEEVGMENLFRSVIVNKSLEQAIPHKE